LRARNDSRGSALKTLTAEGGWFGSDWKKGTSASANDHAALHPHIHSIDSGAARVVAMAPGVGLREFGFDHVRTVTRVQTPSP
jgi:hypothetical protein